MGRTKVELAAVPDWPLRRLGTRYRHCRCRQSCFITTAVIGAVVYAIAPIHRRRRSGGKAVDDVGLNGALRRLTGLRNSSAWA